MIIGGQQFNPANGAGSFSASVAAPGGKVILHNLSPWDVFLTFADDPRRTSILHAWQPREYDFCGQNTPTIAYTPAYTPSASVIAAAPTSFIWGEAFAPGEVVPISHPNYDRLSNVGNTVNTQGGSANVKNDGNGPGTLFIEATPSDQAVSAWSFSNDGSGLLQVLSANTQKTVLKVTRGNNTSTKAIILLGDSADTGITTFYGTVGAGSIVPTSVLAAGALPAGVTIAASQVGSGYPATAIGAGALAAGVTIGAAALTSGALPAGVTLPAAQVSAGTLAGTVDMTNITSDGGAFATDGTGKLTFGRTLSSANQIMDWQQSFGLFSDNVAGAFSGGVNRLWFQAGGATQTQEMHFGSRAGLALAGARFLAANFRIDGSGATTPGLFSVAGGVKTSLDAGAITTDGAGVITATGLKGLLATATASVGVNFKDLSGFVEFDAAAPAATARGIVFAGFDGTSLHKGMQVGTDGFAMLGTNRSGSIVVAGFYSGSATPTGDGVTTPATGSAWFPV